MKCVLSLRVARHLLSKGFKVVDVDSSSKIKGNVVFIFEDSAALKEEILRLRKGEK